MTNKFATDNAGFTLVVTNFLFLGTHNTSRVTTTLPGKTCLWTQGLKIHSSKFDLVYVARSTNQSYVGQEYLSFFHLKGKVKIGDDFISIKKNATLVPASGLRNKSREGEMIR